MRILIAEDDAVSRKFLQKFLASYGECDLTVDGIESVDAFLLSLEDDKPYDFVFLDIMMPKLDGIKALKIMRDIESRKDVEDAKKAKVIMVTALNEKETINNSFEAGCDAYVTKPIDTKELSETIEKLMYTK
jgi:two-component system, chemotaxis family, chemotaxis protein CheY